MSGKELSLSDIVSMRISNDRYYCSGKLNQHSDIKQTPHTNRFYQTVTDGLTDSSAVGILYLHIIVTSCPGNKFYRLETIRT